MVVILPAEGHFTEFAGGLSAERLEEMLSSLQMQGLKLYLSRFQFDTELMLGETLKSMGTDAAFDPMLADLPACTNGKPL